MNQLAGGARPLAPEGIRFALPNADVDLVDTGVGMVNAAAAASRCLAHATPDLLLNVGCAGAHDPTLDIGDVVVGDRYVPLSSLYVDKHGRVHYYGVRRGSGRTSIVEWRTDPRLARMARGPPHVRVGPIGSSDIWLAQRRRVEWVHDHMGTLCEDMEAAAIAQIAHACRVPFLAIKDISNSVYRPGVSFDALAHDVPPDAGKNAGRVAAALCHAVATQQEWGLSLAPPTAIYRTDHSS